ncbi:hypothetical protein A6U92_09370 [Agrobacterium rubi]|nr:hypothetical protein A6U92_09370 [Agrobacterium rubi]
MRNHNAITTNRKLCTRRDIEPSHGLDAATLILRCGGEAGASKDEGCGQWYEGGETLRYGL